MPSAVDTVWKAAVNLVSRWWSRDRSPAARRSRSISMFRACWATQAPVGWAVTFDDMNAAGGDLHEEQHVDPFEERGVDGEEVAGQGGVRLGGGELFPRRGGPAGGRLELGAVYLPAQDRHLVTRYQEFDVFGSAVAGELGQHLQHLRQEQVYRRSAHGFGSLQLPRC